MEKPNPVSRDGMFVSGASTPGTTQALIAKAADQSTSSPI